MVWDELRDFAMGNNLVFANGLLVLMGKLFINLVLWFLAVFIAPLGLLYLWFRTRDDAAGPGK